MTTTSAGRAARQLPRPNAGEWPGLFDPPQAPFRARIAESLFRSAIRRLPVRVSFPDGSHIGGGGRSAPLLSIRRPSAFFSRLGADLKVGFGEAYMVEDWTTGDNTDLADLLTPFARAVAALIPKPLQRLRNLVERRQPASEENTVDQAKDNIHRHYDLSNDLFETFLDETMTYSSAWFEPGDSLADAQRRKIDGILDYARVGTGTSVLEIGTGWGELALRAAERGANVTTLTLSQEQKQLAERRLSAAGFADRVSVQLRDYRDARGSYDAVVSVEMIEAVGEKYWPTYFATLDRLLAPGGRVGLQAITMPHDRMMAARNAYTWIHKYIFPGGLIPSVESIEANLRQHTGLYVAERRDLGLHYAETLRRWRERFHERWDDITTYGFDRTFRRMWEFYLGYSEAGFRSRYLNVFQMSLARTPS